MDKSDRVAVTFFGEGTLDEGSFYEALNYAAIKKLPLLLTCENNLYATETPLNVRQAPGSDLCERVRGFRVDAHRIDGNDVVEVHRAATEAIAQLQRGQGPIFLECMTYRWREHVGPHFDYELGRTYRSREELEAWMERCPVKRSGERLVSSGIATDAELESWRAALQADVDAEIERARGAAWPDVATLFDNV
jgi:pyruvate dehydrogenase E1 component alpha subunit